MRKAGPASLTLLPSEAHPAWLGLRDLAFQLGSEAAGLAGRLVPETVLAIGDLVRGMNCRYSNLIEGHDTRPVDIERALKLDHAGDPGRRDLQLEAAAHVAVQSAIDRDALPGLPPAALAVELHRLFYARLPDSLAQVEELGTGRIVAVRPGLLHEGEVRVGHHGAPSPSELADHLRRFDESAPERFGRAERLVAVAAAHHRLLWIHPFPDGNGRVARLLSHALLRRCGVGSPLWSVARGLARHVDAYRAALARADDPPRGSQDGRGLLSDGRLAEFCRFFLAASLDQVRSMRGLLSPEALGGRMREFVAAEAAGGCRDGRAGSAGGAGRTRGGGAGARGAVRPGATRRPARPARSRGPAGAPADAAAGRARPAPGGQGRAAADRLPLGESERLFPHLWAPAGVAMGCDPELDAALRPPRPD